MNTQSGKGLLQEWIPSRFLNTTTPDEIHYSRGFLLCRPDSWFPGFGGYWSQILDSLDLEAHLVRVRPVLHFSSEGCETYLGSLDDELIGLVMPQNSFHLVGRMLVPDSPETVRHLIVEYFARRFLTTVTSSWSAAGSSGMFRFESEISFESARFAAGVELRFRVAGEDLDLTIGFGKSLLVHFHDLWRSHVLGSAGSDPEKEGAQLVIGNAYLAPSEIRDQLQPGSVMPLFEQEAGRASLSLGMKPWLLGELLYCEEGFAFRTLDPIRTAAQSPRGTTGVQVVLSDATLDGSEKVFLEQRQASYLFPGNPSNDVKLIIGDQEVGKGVLVLDEGRLSVQVQSAIDSLG